MEIIGNYGKKYANALEYALDRNRYNEPIDPITHKGKINISPCWNDWIGLVEHNKGIFEKMEKDDVDNFFRFYDLGYQSGMVLGRKMARG